MATSRERQTTNLPFFDTRMNFSGPVVGRARIDVPNWSNTNMALQPYDLRIHDARPIIDALSLDREGFTLVRHECGITDAFDINTDGPGYQAAGRTDRRQPRSPAGQGPDQAEHGGHGNRNWARTLGAHGLHHRRGSQVGQVDRELGGPGAE